MIRPSRNVERLNHTGFSGKSGHSEAPFWWRIDLLGAWDVHRYDRWMRLRKENSTRILALPYLAVSWCFLCICPSPNSRILAGDFQPNSGLMWFDLWKPPSELRTLDARNISTALGTFVPAGPKSLEDVHSTFGPCGSNRNNRQTCLWYGSTTHDLQSSSDPCLLTLSMVPKVPGARDWSTPRQIPWPAVNNGVKHLQRRQKRLTWAGPTSAPCFSWFQLRHAARLEKCGTARDHETERHYVQSLAASGCEVLHFDGFGNTGAHFLVYPCLSGPNLNLLLCFIRLADTLAIPRPHTIFDI